MARKDFDRYFMQLESQYANLQVTLQDISAEVDSGMMSPERLEEVKRTVAPVKESYDMLRYVKYLLDMPSKKSKRARYNTQSKKVLESTKQSSADAVVKRNNEVLSSLATKH